MEIRKLEKVASHQIYRKKNDKRVPGATTVINASCGWGTQYLIRWAAEEAKEGRDPTKVRDKAADIGTIAHFMVEGHLVKFKPDLSDYPETEIVKANLAYEAYLEWEDQFKDFEFIESEIQLASEEHDYGGTLDLVAKINGKKTYIDFKTSKYVYAQHKLQSVAYVKLYNEHHPDDPIVQIYILKISKEDGSFEDTKVPNNIWEDCWEMFLDFEDLYWRKKKLKF